MRYPGRAQVLREAAGDGTGADNPPSPAPSHAEPEPEPGPEVDPVQPKVKKAAGRLRKRLTEMEERIAALEEKPDPPVEIPVEGPAPEEAAKPAARRELVDQFLEWRFE